MAFPSDGLLGHGDCNCPWCDPDYDDTENHRPIETIHIRGDIL